MKIGTLFILGLVAFPVSVSAAPGDFRVIDSSKGDRLDFLGMR